MIVNQGSHGPTLNIPAGADLYDYLFPNISQQATCVLGIDEFEPYSKKCPDKFGNIERLRRNAWRVTAKNRFARESYKRSQVAVGGLDLMTLSVRDVAMSQDDCVHFSVHKPFPVYEEAVKFMIAMAGRDCPKQ